MLFFPEDKRQVGRLLKRIQDAPAPEPRLFMDVMANACPRTVAMIKIRKAPQLKLLLEAGAWTDAAIVLVKLELPLWKVRRIAYDDGAWYCRLSAQPHLPEGFDDVAESHHGTLALAILGALVEARRETSTRQSAPSQVDDRVCLDPEPIRICCDNFG